MRFSKDERRQAFSSRMKAPFDVFDLLQRHSERRIRIADMIGRRGRFIVLGMAGFYYTYVQVGNEPSANFATIALQDNLFDAVLTSWIFLAFYYSDGFLAAAFYGPQSRIMDGVLARANCLLITTLWTCFKFVLVPIGAQLQPYSRRRVRDRLRADLGLLHRHRRARGDRRFAVRQAEDPRSGDRRRQPQVDRRHGPGFVGALAFVGSWWQTACRHRGSGWPCFAVSIAHVFELFSPRGTDDFTMATERGNLLGIRSLGDVGALSSPRRLPRVSESPSMAGISQGATT